MKVKKRVVSFLSLDGKNGLIDPDGTHEYYPELAHGVKWGGFGPADTDGGRCLVTSYEAADISEHAAGRDFSRSLKE